MAQNRKKKKKIQCSQGQIDKVSLKVQSELSHEHLSADHGWSHI